MSILIFQTADPFKYRRMLDITSRTTIAYCQRHQYQYESYVGLKRGFYDWQAIYNRIVQYKEIMDRGFTGWALYLDADAYINDLSFDLSNYLSDKHNFGAILTLSGASEDFWNINSGVVLINLGHPFGKYLVDAWHAAFMRLSDDELKARESWPDRDDDQYMLAMALKDRPDMLSFVHLESRDLINAMDSRFIRQQLRAYMPNFDERVRSLELMVEEVIGSPRADEIVTQAAPGIVAALYRALLDRDPDAAGLSSYILHLRNVGIERGTRDVASNLLHSNECEARWRP